MVKRLNLDKIKTPVKEFLKNLKVEKDQYVLELGGKSIGALVSVDILNWWRERKERFNVYDRIWEKNKNISEKEIRKDVAETIKVIRSQK